MLMFVMSYILVLFPEGTVFTSQAPKFQGPRGHELFVDKAHPSRAVVDWISSSEEDLDLLGSLGSAKEG